MSASFKMSHERKGLRNHFNCDSLRQLLVAVTCDSYLWQCAYCARLVLLHLEKNMLEGATNEMGSFQNKTMGVAKGGQGAMAPSQMFSMSSRFVL